MNEPYVYKLCCNKIMYFLNEKGHYNINVL